MDVPDPITVNRIILECGSAAARLRRGLRLYFLPFACAATLAISAAIAF
jgi:hypothetical protein